MSAGEPTARPHASSDESSEHTCASEAGSFARVALRLEVELVLEDFLHAAQALDGVGRHARLLRRTEDKGEERRALTNERSRAGGARASKKAGIA